VGRKKQKRERTRVGQEERRDEEEIGKEIMIEPV
jgi:hypothetical protein